MVQKIPQRKDEFVWRELDGETFILSESGDKIITMNKVASISGSNAMVSRILTKYLVKF